MYMCAYAYAYYNTYTRARCTCTNAARLAGGNAGGWRRERQRKRSAACITCAMRASACTFPQHACLPSREPADRARLSAAAFARRCDICSASTADALERRRPRRLVGSSRRLDSGRLGLGASRPFDSTTAPRSSDSASDSANEAQRAGDVLGRSVCLQRREWRRVEP